MKYPDQKLEPIFFHGFKTTICYTNVNIFLIMMFHENKNILQDLKTLHRFYIDQYSLLKSNMNMIMHM